ncbi:MAG: hypothetical protein JWN70_6685 [Planctomycetaceae bacterium]|nr:hypothetical protein [Planctomycetaceae bacterium]
MFATTVNVLKRGGIGFVAGFICAIMVLVFVDWLPPHRDLSQPGLEQQARSLWLATAIASGVAIFAMFAPTIRVSQFWLWFAVVFGGIAVIPVGQFPDGTLVPFGTYYVNLGFQSEKARILGINISAALVIAAIIHWTRLFFRKGRSFRQPDGLDG